MIIVEEDSDPKPPLLIVAQDDTPVGQLETSHFGSVHTQSQSPPTADTPSSYTVSYHRTPLLQPLSPPPSYPKLPSYNHPAPSSPVPAVPHHHYHHPSRSPARRFWKAFAVAFLIYLALLSLIQTVIRMASNGGTVSEFLSESARVMRRALLTWCFAFLLTVLRR